MWQKTGSACRLAEMSCSRQPVLTTVSLTGFLVGRAHRGPIRTSLYGLQLQPIRLARLFAPQDGKILAGHWKALETARGETRLETFSVVATFARQFGIPSSSFRGFGLKFQSFFTAKSPSLFLRAPWQLSRPSSIRGASCWCWTS